MKPNGTSYSSILPHLFNPSHIAVIGATDAPGKIGGEITRNLLHSNRRLMLINHSGRKVFGNVTYATLSSAIAENGSAPEVAYIVLPPHAAAAAMRDCANAGVKAVIVMTADIEGADIDFAQDMERSGMLILGPNCLGIHDNRTGITFNTGLLSSAGPAVFFSQSGSYVELFLLGMNRRGVGVSFAVSTGNEMLTGVEHFLSYAAQLDSISVVGLYVEQLRRPSLFQEACRKAVASGKHVFVHMAGITSEGKKAALSHTRSIAGDVEAYEALFRKCGAVSVPSFTSLLDTAAASVNLNWNGKGDAFVISGPGGLCVSLADALSAKGIELYTPDTNMIEKLRRLFPNLSEIRNPLDLTMAATRKVDMYSVAAEAVSENCGFTIIGGPTSYSTEEFKSEMLRLTRKNDGLVIVWMGDAPAVDIAASSLSSSGIPVFRTPESAADAIAGLWKALKTSDNDWRLPAFFGSNSTCEGRLLTISDTIALLRRYRIDLPLHPISNEEQAAQLAERLGYPVILKAYTVTATHKSRAGLVKPGICNRQMLGEAFLHLRKRLEEIGATDGVVMLSHEFGGGRELIVGGRGALGGRLMVFGAGGVDVENIGHKAFSLLPMSEGEINEIVEASRALPIEARDKEGMQTLFSVIRGVSRMLIAESDITEVDLNPVIFRGKDVVVADARIAVNR
ncbi:MAG: acetate--CoA ligase family protein [Methanomassiliicoccales archaeon]